VKPVRREPTVSFTAHVERIPFQFKRYKANAGEAKSRTTVTAGKAVSLFVSSQWPSLFFMGVGALVIIVALLAAGAGMLL
jgi:hypothetical protein